ncbi:hypothetical protein FRD01_17670 [Microvenator marinus]|uniref:Uncharacterized protein n=1 Tax=Microvenator marinus TaxID=2600177 RepID=A0A5B8XU57_9DELT|nr:hypothetical protein [Microvenator marinus]QED29034.1 hypothetical protein FRD01_17670 [Microvenator marinus]
MKNLWILASALLIGCSAPQDSKPVADEGQTSQELESQPSEMHSSLRGEEGSELPPPTREKVVKEKPKPVVQRVVVATPRARGVVLFESELEFLRGALESRLQADDLFEIKDHSELEDEMKVLKKGKLPNQKACKVLPDPFLAAAGFEGVNVVWPSLVCGAEKCTLKATSGPQTRIYELSANPENWAEELTSAAAVAKEAEVEGTSVELGKYKEPYLVVEDIDGTWDESFQKPLQRAAKQARRCDEGPDRFLVSIAESGKVNSCESDRRHTRKPKSEDCFCKALKRVRFPKVEKKSGERRFSGHLKVLAKKENEARAQSKRAELQLLSSDDPIAHLNSIHLNEKNLRKCADLTEAPTEVGFILEVAGQGEHVAHSTSWTGEVSPELKSCVKGLLRGVTMDCPATERATVRGRIVLRPE